MCSRTRVLKFCHLLQTVFCVLSDHSTLSISFSQPFLSLKLALCIFNRSRVSSMQLRTDDWKWSGSSLWSFKINNGPRTCLTKSISKREKPVVSFATYRYVNVHKEDVYLISCQYAYLRNCVYKSYKTHTESNETWQTYCKMVFWLSNRILLHVPIVLHTSRMRLS